MEHRLAAVPAADGVGYGRLMELNVAGTQAALEAYRKELMEPKTAVADGFGDARLAVVRLPCAVAARLQEAGLAMVGAVPVQ